MSIEQMTEMMSELFSMVQTPEHVRATANYQFMLRLYQRLLTIGMSPEIAAQAVGSINIELYKDMHTDYPDQFAMIVNGFADVLVTLYETMIEDFGLVSGETIFIKGLGQFSVSYLQ